MDIRLATPADKETWDNFVIQNSPSSFLQSWAWGEVLSADGRAPRRLMAQEGGEVRGLALAGLLQATRFFRYVYVPNGPVVAAGLAPAQKNEVCAALLKGVAAAYRARRPIFIAFDPAGRFNHYAEIAGVRRPTAAERRRPAGFEPLTRALLDLKKSEEALRLGMHPKTRYNLKRSARLGVETRVGRAEADWEAFMALLTQTAARQRFRLHPRGHYRAILEAAGEAAFIVTAALNGEALAALLVVFYGERAYYLHGGSSRAHPTVMAPYAAHWAAIQEAQKRGAAVYDFGGASAEPADPWFELTRFKAGFGASVTPVGERYYLTLRPLTANFFNLLKSLKHRLA